MDAFYEYVKLNKSHDVLKHTRLMIATCIPGMDMTKEYEKDYYEAADRTAKKIPLVEPVSGKSFDSVEKLASFIAEQYENSTKNAKEPLSEKEQKMLKEDPTVYTAINFGISG